MRYLNLRQPVYPSRTTATAPDDSHIELPGDVLFDFDKDVVKAEAEPTLAQVAGVVRSHLAGAPKGSYVMVNGHTDNVGAAGYNEALSERRAQAVARWLVDRQYVTAEQVKTQGWGETRPKASNKRPGGRRLNRRVEFFVRKM
jgi:outer membrane protein OmpA-like peptidoglycan-associated protein